MYNVYDLVCNDILPKLCGYVAVLYSIFWAVAVVYVFCALCIIVTANNEIW